MKDAYQDQRGLSALETLAQDTRYAVRTLLRTPGFTLAALLTLALGIGANTAIFSVVNAVLLRPLPYPEPDRIVALMRRYPGGEYNRHTGRRYFAFRDGMQTVLPMAAWRSPVGVNLVTGEHAEYVRAMPVSKEFFETFQVRPVFGEPFQSEHDSEGGPDVVILSEGLWRRSFGGNPGVVGTSVLLGERSHTVLGIMPAWFETVPPADVYVPLRPSLTGPGSGTNYHVAARLKPGVTHAQASAEAAVVWEAYRREYPRDADGKELPASMVPLQETLSSSMRPALLTMLGAVGLLLLIACANTANLLLARSSGRSREIAVRVALGAGRGRIIRQLLTESVLLSLAGAALGLLAADWSVPALLALTPPGYTIFQEVRIDTTVLVVTLAVALGTGMLFGLAPALSLSRLDIVEAFKEEGGRTTGGRQTRWLRGALVTAEIAICMVLLVGAGLLIQTFIRMRAIDPGFDVRGLLTAQMSLQGDRYADVASLNRFFEQGLESIRRIPGVRDAAIVNGVPLEFGLNLNVDVLDGPERIENALTDWRYASATYFQVMDIPIVAGRGFQGSDRAGTPPVAVVNEEFARRFFKGTSPIGRHIRVFDSDGQIEIVGIAKDVREHGLVTRQPAVMWVPIAQANPDGVRASHTYFAMSWVVRTGRPAAALAQEMREAIRRLDPHQPFSEFRTMEQIRDADLATERFQMTLLGTFAGIGLLLAAAGVYGLLAYAVAQRTREFGIRMALGATRGRILGVVLRHGAALGAIGVAVGTVGAFALTRTLQGFVYGVSTLDPPTFAAVAVVLLLVAALASLLPALRATRLNPVAALRE